MIGPAAAAEWVWQQWHGADRELCLVAARAEQLIGAWLGQLSSSERLADAIRRELAHLERISVTELKTLISGRSPRQLEDLAAERAARLDLDVEWLRWALGLSEAGWFTSQAAAPGTAARLTKLLGVLPALLVRPASPRALAALAQRLFEISEEAPAADLGLAVEESAFAQWQISAPARLASALTEGLIALRPRGVDVSAPSGKAIEYDEDTFARSRAERVLFDELQARARTRGLFALNVKLGADPPLEVDLLCKDLKVAIEIDGYHHFRDAAHYRRDRHKDVRLQELGYLVVRVLAIDIDDELAHVLERIDRVVADRRGGRDDNS
jgi:very-short-patch-repair endonuclease